ncbi:MAG: hypothetical protein FJ344_02180 [Sphingomonadales bacterium]|nr:hypothetical protein [Sphingomonadales bacterium]
MVQGDWSWMMPPMIGSSSHIFHQKLKNQAVSPNFFYCHALPELSKGVWISLYLWISFPDVPLVRAKGP